jgi:2'-5' RNA ligase
MKPVRAAAPAARWVDEDRIHLTVKFLGDQPEAAVEPLLGAIATVAARYDPIPLEVGGLNAFPNLRSPRVVWVGVRADPKLELLQHDIERACEALGHEVEGRAYRPHVTVGRVEPREISAERLAVAARSVSFCADALAETVDLMVSETVDRRLTYRVVGSAALSRH